MDVGDHLYNPLEPGFAENPYPHYARMRDANETQRTPFGNVVLHRYDDCFTLLRQAGTSVDERNATNLVQPVLPDDLAQRDRTERRRHSLLNLDPPDHTRIRRLVSSAFTVRRVEQLRDRVRVLVDELLDEVAEAGADGEPVDLMSRFAFPLPFEVITELLGMPEGDRDQLRAWAHTMTAGLEPFVDDDTVRKIFDAADLMDEHIYAALEWKRRNPADDLLSALIAAEEDGDTLSPTELVAQVVLLYIAGHETTVNLIGNGTFALLTHRDQLERLIADPSLDANAVDELLRWDSPVQLSRRIVMTETEIGGETLSPGELVLTLLAAANHDPAHWGATVDELDLGREGANGHLSFGSGVHHCLGSNLARLEGAEAIGALVRRFPKMEMASDTAQWNGRVVLRGLDALEIATES